MYYARNRAQNKFQCNVKRFTISLPGHGALCRLASCYVIVEKFSFWLDLVGSQTKIYRAIGDIVGRVNHLAAVFQPLRIKHVLAFLLFNGMCWSKRGFLRTFQSQVFKRKYDPLKNFRKQIEKNISYVTSTDEIAPDCGEYWWFVTRTLTSLVDRPVKS